MVFSFFKKQPEKMIARPAAVPRQVAVREHASENGKEQRGEQDQTASDAKLKPLAGNAAPQETSSGFSDFVFSESAPDFQIETDIDPVDAEAEEAAVLFANNQDQAAQAVLEHAVQNYHSGPGERLWLMLFDLYRLSGQQPAFEALGIEYARAFEKSPPGWGNKVKEKTRKPSAAAGSMFFKGDLLGENAAGFQAVSQTLEKNPKLRLDMSKVRHSDPEGCGCLLSLLQKARKSGREIELLGREALGELVQGQVETGRAENKAHWLLLLELCQLQGKQEAFEEIAIDYAVTFEESPPSWESARVAAPEPVIEQAQVVELETDTAYFMRGEIKSSRFGDLAAHVGEHDPVLIDCAELTRMDFISAGALLNELTKIRSSGKQIVFRHPNHLVAELLGVIGLKSVATVVFARQ